MKVFNKFLVAVSAFDWLAQAAVIQLDLTVKVDSKPEVLQNEGGSMERAKTTKHAVKPQDIKLGENDVDLSSFAHRGFLSEDGSYLNFSNIPYAEPPTGYKRFNRPEYYFANEYTINYGNKSRICPQMQVGWVPKALDFLDCYAGAIKDKPTCSFKKNWTDIIVPDNYTKPENWKNPQASEDCLLLDVFVPKSVWDNREDEKKPKAPVVVWIHGGGFIYGWKSQAGGPAPLFEAAKKGKQDIIYVAMNYRLGAFGWLGGSDYVSQGGTPNVGLYDQIVALDWVQDNIELFGGNRDSVTVMGQSAGASSILHHLTSYGGEEEDAKPPFTRAILQSPAFFPEGNLDLTSSTFLEFMLRSNVFSLQALKSKSTEELQEINAQMTYYSQYGLFKFGPVVDSSYVTKLPGQLLAEGKYHKNIPMILGHTLLDGLLFTPPWIRDDDALAAYVQSLYPGLPNSVYDTIKQADYYKIPKNGLEISKINAVSDFLDDVAISCNNYYLTEAALKTGDVPIYRYLFGAKPAIHGSDLPFEFYPTATKFDFVEPDLAKFMQQKFVNFIRTGDPNDKDTPSLSSPKWPRYQLDNGLVTRTIMNFGDLTGPKRYAGADPLSRKRCALWQPAPFRPAPEELLRKQSAESQWEL